MEKDPNGGGTHMDGSLSTDYCSFCFVDGAFTGQDCTAQEMQMLCIQKLQEQGASKPLAWLLTRGIPNLKRWKPA